MGEREKSVCESEWEEMSQGGESVSMCLCEQAGWTRNKRTRAASRPNQPASLNNRSRHIHKPCRREEMVVLSPWVGSTELSLFSFFWLRHSV